MATGFIPTSIDVARSVDPNVVSGDVFFDDDIFLNVGIKTGETTQSFGRFGYDSAANCVRLDYFENGAGVQPQLCIRRGDSSAPVDVAAWRDAGFLQFYDLSSATVSATGTGGMRYNDTTKAFECSVDGGVWTALATAGPGNSLDQAYNAGRVITADAGSVEIDGAADQIQLLVSGHSTQTSDIVVIENSAGTDLVSIDNAGNITIAGDLTIGSVALSSSAASDGASLIGYDSSANAHSSATDVATALDDLASAITAEDLWDRTSGIIHPKTGTDKITVGGATTAIFGSYVGVMDTVDGGVSINVQNDDATGTSATSSVGACTNSGSACVGVIMTGDSYSGAANRPANFGIFETGSATSGMKLQAQVGSMFFATALADRAELDDKGNWTYTQAAQTASSPTFVEWTAGVHTALTAAEAIDFNFDAARTVEFTTAAAIPTQRVVYVQAPTYAATVATQTIDEAATVAISGAPVAGTNVAITDSYALWVQSGTTKLDGKLHVVDSTLPARLDNSTGNLAEFLEFRSTAAAASGNDALMIYRFKDDAGNDDVFASTRVEVSDVTDGSEDAAWCVSVISGGNLNDHLVVGPTSYQFNIGVNTIATMSSAGLNPGADSTYSLGENSTPLRWLNVHTDEVTIGGVALSSSATSDGASLVGYDPSGNASTASTTVAGALDDIGNAIAAAGPWDTTSGVVHLDTSANNVTVGSTTNLAKLGVDGDTDEIQLLVQGHSTQTSDLVVVEASSGTDLFNISLEDTHIQNALALDDDSPTSFAVDQNNLALGDKSVHRLTSSADIDISGFVAPSVQEVAHIINVGSFAITILEGSGLSVAANQVITGIGDITLQPDDSVTIWYDATTARWRVIS